MINKQTGMGWGVGVAKKQEPNPRFANEFTAFKSYRYKRVENGPLDPKLKEANDFFEGKEPEDIVRLLNKKFGG